MEVRPCVGALRSTVLELPNLGSVLKDITPIQPDQVELGT